MTEASYRTNTTTFFVPTEEKKVSRKIRINYSTFGMVEPGRSYTLTNDSSYHYLFNGKYHDDNIWGKDNSYDYGNRFYDPRLGRFASTDPLFKKYAMLTPYQFSSNTPIQAVDLDGKEAAEAVVNKQIFTPLINGFADLEEKVVSLLSYSSHTSASVSHTTASTSATVGGTTYTATSGTYYSYESTSILDFGQAMEDARNTGKPTPLAQTSSSYSHGTETTVTASNEKATVEASSKTDQNGTTTTTYKASGQGTVDGVPVTASYAYSYGSSGEATTTVSAGVGTTDNNFSILTSATSNSVSTKIGVGLQAQVWQSDNKSERALVYLSEIFSHSSLAVTKKYIGITDKVIADVYLSL